MHRCAVCTVLHDHALIMLQCGRGTCLTVVLHMFRDSCCIDGKMNHGKIDHVLGWV